MLSEVYLKIILYLHVLSEKSFLRGDFFFVRKSHEMQYLLLNVSTEIIISLMHCTKNNLNFPTQ